MYFQHDCDQITWRAGGRQNYPTHRGGRIPTQCKPENSVFKQILNEVVRDRARVWVDGSYLSRGRRSVERMVDVIGDIASKAPVVAAVLKEVHDWHCCIWEPVDENCLEQSLRIVANPETKEKDWTLLVQKLGRSNLSLHCAGLDYTIYLTLR